MQIDHAAGIPRRAFCAALESAKANWADLKSDAAATFDITSNSTSMRTAVRKSTNPDLPIGKQCELLSISRSSFCYRPKGETALNLMLMRQIDEQFLETPLFGVR